MDVCPMSFPPYFLFFGGLCASLIVVALIVLASRIITVKPKRQQPLPRKFVKRHHPVLGSYSEDEDGHWWSCITSERLGYEVSVRCTAAGPTDAQIEHWREIEQRLPELLHQTPPPPDDDGWGNKPGPFDVSSLQADFVELKDDENFMVGIHVPRTGRFYLAPFMHVGSDWRPYFEWVV